jgi:Uma2 family endonuclease
MKIEAPSGEERTILRGVSWSTYEALLADLGEHRGRIAYDQGLLEIMSPSQSHEGLKRLIGRLVEMLSLELGIEILSTSSLTLKRPKLLKAVEADESYYIQNEARVRHKEIDLAVDPPPDLAIEVEVSRSAIDRLGIYAALRVPEVWRHDGTSLKVLVLQGDGSYGQSDQSRAFPMLSVDEFARFLEMRSTFSENQVVIGFRDWIRTHLERA